MSQCCWAQETVVSGRILEMFSNSPILDVEISILDSGLTTYSDSEGRFIFSGKQIPEGDQILQIQKSEYITKKIPLVVERGKSIVLDPLFMNVDLAEIEAKIGVISLSENDLNNDDGSSFYISGLLGSSKDVFQTATAYDFSSTFFRPRGLDASYGKVLINGIEMNRIFNGRPQWANWGGLNDAQRNQEFTFGIGPTDLNFGGLAGTTNIIMRASQYRPSARLSIASANRTYQWRIMGSYNSGMSRKGWAYSVLISKRFGEQGFIDGTLYDANSLFVSVEKRISDGQYLNFSGFYASNKRGRSTAITEEVYRLKGIRYNPNWGYQQGELRNSRIREIVEPVIMFNHNVNLGDSGARLNTNLSYQFGKIGNSRIDNGGTRLLETEDGEQAYLGGARNPLPNYYQLMPSYFLRDDHPGAVDFQNAYLAEQEFINDGQLDWQKLYEANAISMLNGGNSIYVVQEDRTDESQLQINTNITVPMNDKHWINAGVSFRNIKSENFAYLKDLLGGKGYLDVDFFAEDASNAVVRNLAQSDLRNPNRIVKQGERYKYNYEINSSVISAFAQARFRFTAMDLYIGGKFEQTSHQRTGLYENGNFPGTRSQGAGEKLSFSTYGIKLGGTYNITGRHLVQLNGAYLTKAPSVNSSFSNARQNNDAIIGLKEERITSLDLSYIHRGPMLRAKLTGFYNTIEDQTDIGFYFTENISGLGLEQDAFVQEITAGINTRRMGAELGIEAQLTSTFKLKGAASFGEYVYTNNPDLYLTSDDFEGALAFGDGTTKLKNYHVAAGPERAYQLGFEYRDPQFWWVGLTTNYFSNAYLDINMLARTANFTSDFDGNTFNDYDPELATELLRQQEFDSYYILNIVGGKSWRIRKYFVGFFATINNLLNQEYISGGFEQGRLTNFRDIRDDKDNRYGRVFGPRYFFGNGTTYYINFYIRF